METKLKKRCEINDEYKWDLSSLFKDENEFLKTRDTLLNDVSDLEKFKGHIVDSADSLYNFLVLDEKIDIQLENLYVYAHMDCDSESGDSKKQARKMMIEKLNDDIGDRLSFIVPEILKTNYDEIKALIDSDKRLQKYSFFFEKLYRYVDHTLSPEEEEIISKATSAFGTGSDVFYNLDNTDINLGIIKDENGNEVELTNSNYNKYMNSKKREVRIDAFNHMFNYFKRFQNTIAASLKGNIKEDYFLSSVKKYTNPLEMSLYGDNIKVDVYKKLIAIIHDNMDAMYEYMRLRKKALNLDEMHMYDIYVDLVDSDKRDIPFEEAKQMIFDALKPLGDRYINDLNQAFNDRWIDIYPNVGKKSGAYSWGTYQSKPYLLLNYNGTIDSVSTAAHELGHSMHSFYSNTNQDYIYHQYPIFLAEIASTVNETLLNDYLYKHAKTKEEKILYLTEFLDKGRTTIYRQTMFAEFEMIMHDKYQANIPLTAEEFNTTYYNLNKLYYGENIVSDDLIKYEWARIPHFYTSFYVYKYATGLSAALAITKDILDGKKEALDNYLTFLSSGGNDYPLNILKKCGIDMVTGEPVEKAISMFREKLAELKSIIES